MLQCWFVCEESSVLFEDVEEGEILWRRCFLGELWFLKINPRLIDIPCLLTQDPKLNRLRWDLPLLFRKCTPQTTTHGTWKSSNWKGKSFSKPSFLAITFSEMQHSFQLRKWERLAIISGNRPSQYDFVTKHLPHPNSLKNNNQKSSLYGTLPSERFSRFPTFQRSWL